MRYGHQRELLLRKSDGGDYITLSMIYDETANVNPFLMLAEKDLLAPMFDALAKPVYLVRTSRIDAIFKDFKEALDRYYELVRNWKATESYVQPSIFKWNERWREGAPSPEKEI